MTHPPSQTIFTVWGSIMTRNQHYTCKTYRYLCLYHFVIINDNNDDNKKDNMQFLYSSCCAFNVFYCVIESCCALNVFYGVIACIANVLMTVQLVPCSQRALDCKYNI